MLETQFMEKLVLPFFKNSKCDLTQAWKQHLYFIKLTVKCKVILGEH